MTYDLSFLPLLRDNVTRYYGTQFKMIALKTNKPKNKELNLSFIPFTIVAILYFLLSMPTYNLFLIETVISFFSYF
jgi:hypothetical protein